MFFIIICACMHLFMHLHIYPYIYECINYLDMWNYIANLMKILDKNKKNFSVLNSLNANRFKLQLNKGMEMDAYF